MFCCLLQKVHYLSGVFFSQMPDDLCFLPLNLILSYNSPNHSLIYVDGRSPLATVSLSVMES